MQVWRKLSKRWRIIFALAFAILILCVVGLVVLDNRSQPSPPPITALPPPPDTGPPLDLSALPVTPPNKPPASCPTVALADRNGAWVVPWMDDSGAADLVPSQTKRLGLMDFFWLAMGPTPGSILQHPTNPEVRSLNSVLAAAHSANPCGLRFVTIVDDYHGTTDPKEAKARLARILLDPQARQQHVQAVAKEMATHPLADGLTVDYEYDLPTKADLPLYAKIGNLEQLLADQPDQFVDRITMGYSRLMQDLAVAMHHQQRLLRVTTFVREHSKLDYGNLPAYIADYGAIARHADQLVLMAYDNHWSSGDPGPIAPLDWVRKVWEHANEYDIPPGRLAVGVPAYAYDWTVNAAGKTVRVATDLTATQVAAARWTKAGGQDGETNYTYQDGQGDPHQVWDATSGVAVKTAAIRQFCSCPVMAWKLGNTDPVGSNLVLSALG